MPECDIHQWERLELRDSWITLNGLHPSSRTLWYLGYRCRWCGEQGYGLDLEKSTR